jgi:hypothetical protein
MHQRTLPSRTRNPPFLFVTDACASGMSAMSISLLTGEVRWFRLDWPFAIPRSTESEPLAILTGLMTIFPPHLRAKVKCLTDSSAAVGAYTRQYSHSPQLNLHVSTLATQRPLLTLELEHLPGIANIMDATSRSAAATLNATEIQEFIASRSWSTQIKEVTELHTDGIQGLF